jgi:parallel beta-helix repeat protein
VIKKTSKVTVSGFTIEYPQTFYDVVTIISSSNIMISGNIIRTNPQVQGPNGTFIKNSNGVILRGNNVTGNLYGVAISGGYGNIIQANNITGNQVSDIILGSTAGNQIKNNLLRKAQSGIELHSSTGNIIKGNLAIANNTIAGILMVDSNTNLIVQNNIDFNRLLSPPAAGVYLQNAAGNNFYYNNIRNNSIQFFGVFGSDLMLNIWNDSAVKPRGNFWSDYNGVDVDKDGVGDTKVPWPCPTGGRPCSSSGPPGVDYFPLMNATKPPVLNVTAFGAPHVGCTLPTPVFTSFNVTVKGGSTPYSYAWNFGDGFRAGNITQVIHGYTTRGDLFASVSVNDTSLPKNTSSDLVAITLFTGNLTLRVFGDSGRPLPGANVTFFSQPPGQQAASILADYRGVAFFPCLAPGPYVIDVSSPGYVLLEKTLTMTGSANNQTVTLVRPSVPSSLLSGILVYAGIGGAVAVALVASWFVLSRRKARRAVQGKAKMG